MDTTAQRIQEEIKNILLGLGSVKSQAEEAYAKYWGTNANVEIGAVANGTDAVTVSSKLTKSEFLAGITMSEQIKNLFGNAAVTQSAYAATVRQLIHGDTAASAALSGEVESIGDALLSLSSSLNAISARATAVLDDYFKTELSAAVGAISDSRIVFGASVTKALLVSGIILIQQIAKFLGNEAVTTGDYAATLAQWRNV